MNPKTRLRLQAFALLLAFGLSVPAFPARPAFAEEEDEKLISVDFDSVPLKDVLKIFSQQSGLNFVASEEAEAKRVTVFLENVPVQEALDGIVNANGLKYEKKKGVYVVSPSAVEGAAEGGPAQTRIFRIKFARFSNSPIDVGGQSTVRDLIRPEEVTALQQNGQPANPSSEEKKDDEEEKNKNLMAERGIDKIIASMLTETGKIAVDSNTNSLIVTDTAAKLAEVEKVISRIDVPTTQVMIEVQLLEVNKSVLGNYGVEWGTVTGRLASFTPGRRSTGFPFNAFYKSPGLRADTDVDGITGDTNTGSTLLSSVLSFTEATAILRYLTNQQDTKILARPRVLTLNNEAANIKLVTETVVGVKSTLVTSQSLTTFTVDEGVTRNTGITMKMTPQINDDNTLNLFVEPSITTVTTSVFFPTRFLEPTTRSVRTITRLQDNSTLVLGGLIDNQDLVTNKKIPILGDLPLVGNAFKYEDSNRRNREFVIFITPHIVQGYDSLSAHSATSIGKDLAVKRMLDTFKEDELKLSLPPVESEIRGVEPVLVEEKKLIAESAKRKLAGEPALDQEMTRTLDQFSRRTDKSNISTRG
ncbi:MAG TPA: secretin N-terminal domain-containing protein, partial [Candidatus Eisenbacteria bacterium]|nr:secretin N-terminal domain-containing protein [Candidatus Eisenbacteria bacterium]